MSGKSFHHTTILRPCSYFRCFCEYTLVVKCILVAAPPRAPAHTVPQSSAKRIDRVEGLHSAEAGGLGWGLKRF